MSSGIPRALRSARRAWKLDLVDLAAGAGVEVEVAARAEETGAVRLSELDALVRVLGGSVDDLLAGRRFWEAPSLALKAAGGGLDVPLLRWHLMGLARAGRDYESMRALLELPDRWRSLGRKLGPVPVSSSAARQGEKLAAKVREAAGEGDAPIPSVRHFASRLGVASFLADFGASTVDGLMWREVGHAPRIAANVRARGGLVTALRMALAHELCHALFDRPRSGAGAMFDRQGPVAEAVEKRANAFAIHLLAPQRAVRGYLNLTGVSSSRRPTAQHLYGLSIHFGVGVEAMAYQLVNCGLWERRDVYRNRGLRSPPYGSDDDRELRSTGSESEVAIERRGSILDLATQALQLHLITAARWRELVGLGVGGVWRMILSDRRADQDLEFHSEVA